MFAETKQTHLYHSDHITRHQSKNWQRAARAENFGLTRIAAESRWLYLCPPLNTYTPRLPIPRRTLSLQRRTDREPLNTYRNRANAEITLQIGNKQSTKHSFFFCRLFSRSWSLSFPVCFVWVWSFVSSTHTRVPTGVVSDCHSVFSLVLRRFSTHLRFRKQPSTHSPAGCTRYLGL